VENGVFDPVSNDISSMCKVLVDWMCEDSDILDTRSEYVDEEAGNIFRGDSRFRDRWCDADEMQLDY